MFSSEDCCLSFKHRVVVITGLYSRTELHITLPEILSTFFFRRMLTSSSQRVLIKTQLIILHGMHCKKQSTFGENSTPLSTSTPQVVNNKEWRNLCQRFIGRSINEWRQRLEKVVEKQGVTMNMFSDYINTWQTTVYNKTIILI